MNKSSQPFLLFWVTFSMGCGAAAAYQNHRRSKSNKKRKESLCARAAAELTHTLKEPRPTLAPKSTRKHFDTVAAVDELS